MTPHLFMYGCCPLVMHFPESGAESRLRRQKKPRFLGISTRRSWQPFLDRGNDDGGLPSFPILDRSWTISGKKVLGSRGTRRHSQRNNKKLFFYSLCVWHRREEKTSIFYIRVLGYAYIYISSRHLRITLINRETLLFLFPILFAFGIHTKQ